MTPPMSVALSLSHVAAGLGLHSRLLRQDTHMAVLL